MKKLFAGMIAILCVLLTGCSSTSTQTLSPKPLDSAPVVNTSAENNSKEIYSDDIVSVSFVKKYDEPDLMKGEFFIDIKAENKSNNEITVYLKDVSLNDKTVQVGSGVPLIVLPGKSGNNTFFGKYEGTGITSTDGIEKLGFKIGVMDESANTIETTKPIEIKF